MKKTSRKKSNRAPYYLLIPVVALVIALPTILTFLVETPVGGSHTEAETDLTLDSDDSGSANGNAGMDGNAGAVDMGGNNADDGNINNDMPFGGNMEDGNGGSGTDDWNADSSASNDTALTESGNSESDAASSFSQEELAGSWEQAFTLSDVPAYSGALYAVIHDNIPFFPKTPDATESFERYAELDTLGRCGTAYANVGQDIMPTEERGAIGQIRPSGWHTVKYDGIDGNYLYNRCHLIAYQLAGENANERNLITGTRYFNATGMLPFEEMVGNYVRETNHHVLYRVTPMFRGNNLVADGVLMEAWSVEDQGAGICFNVFVYNVQPGIVIDYATGDSYAVSGSDLADGSNSANPGNALADGGSSTNPANDNADSGSSANSGNDLADGSSTAPAITPPAEPPTSASQENPVTADYILNTNTFKFHYPYCDSVQEMAERNKLPYSGTRDEVIAMGYVPCKRCNP